MEEAAPDSEPSEESKWTRLVKRFERVIVLVLILFLMVVVAISTVELGWVLFGDLSSVREILLDPEEMFGLFGFFLLVLIGLELLTTLKVHIQKGVVHVEVVLEVALIAIAQKIILLDTSRYAPASLLGLAALVLVLAMAFRLIRGGREGGKG
jgi:uncharacterized membrane protein (DUF373 family)